MPGTPPGVVIRRSGVESSVTPSSAGRSRIPWGQAVADQGSRPAKPKRWGLRTLAFLGLAAASIILSNYLRMVGNDNFALLTFIGTVVGLVGATVCSIRGLRSWGGLPRPRP
jgi:hypothetical protein